MIQNMSTIRRLDFVEPANQRAWHPRYVSLLTYRSAPAEEFRPPDTTHVAVTPQPDYLFTQ